MQKSVGFSGGKAKSAAHANALTAMLSEFSRKLITIVEVTMADSDLSFDNFRNEVDPLY